MIQRTEAELKAEIISKFRKCARDVKDEDCTRAWKAVRKLFNPNAFPYEFRSGYGTGKDFHGILPYTSMWQERKWLEICYLIEDVLRLRGYRDAYTRQEHSYIGSTVLIKDPYVVTTIAKGKISLEEARRSRALEIVLFTNGELFGMHCSWVPISLEEIDGDGRTMRNPRVLDPTKLERIFRSGPPLPPLEKIFSECAITPPIWKPDPYWRP
jgi:hypothetical protein